MSWKLHINNTSIIIEWYLKSIHTRDFYQKRSISAANHTQLFLSFLLTNGEAIELRILFRFFRRAHINKLKRSMQTYRFIYGPKPQSSIVKQTQRKEALMFYVTDEWFFVKLLDEIDGLRCLHAHHLRVFLLHLQESSQDRKRRLLPSSEQIIHYECQQQLI